MESIRIGFIIQSKTSLLTGIFFLLFFDGNFHKAKAKKTDSVNTLLIQEFNRKLSIIDGQRQRLHQKVELETKLLSLKQPII
jgi:hypothetical protein